MTTPTKEPKVKLGVIGHFGLAVRDPEAAASFWQRSFNLQEVFRADGAIALGNDALTLVLFKGEPAPQALGHMSFHVPDMASLRDAVTLLKRNGVELEDPGDEIGPEAPDSPHMGLWFHDPDGYRWELSVQNARP